MATYDSDVAIWAEETCPWPLPDVLNPDWRPE